MDWGQTQPHKPGSPVPRQEQVLEHQKQQEQGMIGQETGDFLVSLVGHLQDKGELAKGDMEDCEWYQDSKTVSVGLDLDLWCGRGHWSSLYLVGSSLQSSLYHVRAFTGVMGQGTWSKEFGSHQNT